MICKLLPLELPQILAISTEMDEIWVRASRTLYEVTFYSSSLKNHVLEEQALNLNSHHCIVALTDKM